MPLTVLRLAALTAGFVLFTALCGVLLMAFADAVGARRRHRELLALLAHGDPKAPGALVVDHPDPAIPDAYRRFVTSEVVRNARIGRQLPALSERQGLDVVSVVPVTAVFRDVAEAEVGRARPFLGEVGGDRPGADANALPGFDAQRRLGDLAPHVRPEFQRVLPPRHGDEVDGEPADAAARPVPPRRRLRLERALGAGVVDVTRLGLDAAVGAAFLALLVPQLRDAGAVRVALGGALLAAAAVPLLPAGVPVLVAALAVVPALVRR